MLKHESTNSIMLHRYRDKLIKYLNLSLYLSSSQELSDSAGLHGRLQD